MNELYFPNHIILQRIQIGLLGGHIDAFVSLKIKEQALDKTKPINGKPGRYRPDGNLMAFLKGL